MPEIVPSLLSADFSKLEQEIRSVENAGATRLHLDVMDGHFVPNITFGPILVKAIRKLTKLHLETHLMIENPEKYLESFIKAGSNTIQIQVEASKDIPKDLQTIKDLGAKAGLVINPPTPFKKIEPFLHLIDHLLVMTVNPGFGGQSMIFDSLEKVTHAKEYSKKYNFLIEIDGGVNANTIKQAASTEMDHLVAGSAVFKGNNPGSAFEELSKLLCK